MVLDPDRERVRLFRNKLRVLQETYIQRAFFSQFLQDRIFVFVDDIGEGCIFGKHKFLQNMGFYPVLFQINVFDIPFQTAENVSRDQARSFHQDLKRFLPFSVTHGTYRKIRQQKRGTAVVFQVWKYFRKCFHLLLVTVHIKERFRKILRVEA